MSNVSSISVSSVRTPRALNTDSTREVEEKVSSASVEFAGTRKLVRPSLSAQSLSGRSFARRSDSPRLAHHEAMTSPQSSLESTHAEAFYLQKQAQSQTQMVFVLEDGERIEGYVEWYDRHTIKVRNHSRTLIYKSSIKYLFKTGENQ